MAVVTKAQAIPAWHFLRDNGLLGYGYNVQVQPGGIYTAVGRLKLCENGLHGAERAIDAVLYAPGALVCRVHLYGGYLRGADKLCARYREVVWMADATRTLHLFAVWCAEQALLRERSAGREPLASSWEALHVKQRWIEGRQARATSMQPEKLSGKTLMQPGHLAT